MASLLILAILMFIGGSPGSCAGGIKTSTAAIAYAFVRSALPGRRDVTLFDRCIPLPIVRKAILLIFLAAMWNIAGCLILCATQPSGPHAGLSDILFEQVSAFATVGLSTGLTPLLTPLGKLWIIASMFVGRVSPLAIATWALEFKTTELHYPEEQVMIG